MWGYLCDPTREPKYSFRNWLDQTRADTSRRGPITPSFWTPARTPLTMLASRPPLIALLLVALAVIVEAAVEYRFDTEHLDREHFLFPSLTF